MVSHFLVFSPLMLVTHAEMEEICSSCSNVHSSCTGSDCATSFFSAYAGYFFHFCAFYLFVYFVLKSTCTIQIHLLISLSIPHAFLFIVVEVVYYWKAERIYIIIEGYMTEKPQNMLDSDSFQCPKCPTDTSCILYMCCLDVYVYMNAFFNCSSFWIYSNLAEVFDRRTIEDRESGMSILTKMLPYYYSDDHKRKLMKLSYCKMDVGV